MAVTRGCNGILKIKDTAATSAAARIYRIRNWEINEDADRLDSSEIGACTKEFTAGAVETGGTIQCWWDPAATSNQSDVVVANDVYMEVYPAGSGSGSTFYKTPTGGANISNVTKTGGVEGIVEMNFTYSVNGAMTATTVP